MQNISEVYQLILEINNLKLVFRNTATRSDRNESTAEHSWSVSMIAIILMEELKKEFSEIDELKVIKLALIHDVVEIYAGDVIAFDAEARKNKEKVELEALEKLAAIYPAFGKQLCELWHEGEKKESIEAKIAKAADSICPIFLRLRFKQSYAPFNVTLENLEKTKRPCFEFSKTFMGLYEKLKVDLLEECLIFSNMC